MASSREFRSRSALRSRAEDAAQNYADTSGEPAKLYEVHGGYEARPATAGPPKGTHTDLLTLHPRGGYGPGAPEPEATNGHAPKRTKTKGGRK